MAQCAAHHQAHMLTVAVTEAGEGQVLSGSHTGYSAGRHRTVHVMLQN